ncbi:MAG: four helix bundle protein [Cyclobacteriaceae bacterium]
MSYKNLDVWRLARELTIEVHKMTLELPAFENFEEGRQMRRSIKSVRSNIVEGYGRRIYKAEYVRFINFALSSNDESIDHLETLFETGSLKDQATYEELHKKFITLERKLNNFLKAIQGQHEKPGYMREPDEVYQSELTTQNPESGIQNPKTKNQHPESSIQNPVNTWKTLSTKFIYENKWIKLDEHRVLNPAGGKGIYGKVHFKNRAIGVIPLDDDQNTWLVGQFRYTLNQWSWEIPEGGGPLDQDPLDAAKRELKEETGLSANKWTEILTIHLSNSVSDEVGHVFVAENLQEGEAELEETEADLKIWKLPLKQAIDMVMSGKITDSLTVPGFLKLARLRSM